MPGAEAIAAGMGIGRLVLGGGLLAAPTTAARLLGVDSASAKRMAFLARMAAIRDMGLGVGTLASRGTPQVALWLGVAAAADAVDALVVGAATKQGATRGIVALGTVAGAAAAAGLGGWAALRSRR
jgi:hypothetical protein